MIKVWILKKILLTLKRVGKKRQVAIFVLIYPQFISDVEREKCESFAFALPSRGANIGFNTRYFEKIDYKNIILSKYSFCSISKAYC